MEQRNNIMDILTSYYELDEEVIETAQRMNIKVEDAAELRAHLEADTDNGKELYDTLIAVLRELDVLYGRK